MHWYKEKIDTVFNELKSSESGLQATEAAKRLQTYGPNELTLAKKPLWKKIIEPFSSIFVLILLFAAGVSIFSHELLDAIIIFIIIGVNAGIYYSQQYVTERVLRSLKKHQIQYVDVLRDGATAQIAASQLVPGDVVLLGEGQRIPADIRLIHTDNLTVDESALTGESLPITKHNAPLESDKPIYEQHNMAFQGTFILSGSAKGIVVHTGQKTEFGSIATLATTAESKSPMQAKIDAVINTILRILTVVAVVIYFLSLARGISAAESLRFVLSFSVAAVPEGLPIALSVVIVLGMRRMAKKQALVRSFKAIEDIGLITTIATDKTGTLTKNKLHVVDAWAASPKFALKEAAEKSIGIIEGNHDPLDHALKTYSGKSAGIGNPLVTFPFDLGLRMSGAAWQESNKVAIYIKGAPEHILRASRLTSKATEAAESAMHHFASNGFRVIALAKTTLKSAPQNLSACNKDLEFLGFIAFEDELRPEARPAIAAAHAAGIQVRMITGDHYQTAFHIGKTLGIANHTDAVITGNELSSDLHLLEKSIAHKTVFARILPEQKYAIVQALEKQEITAMTGDGVNDVPALVKSTVGVAMGSGSDIAKDAGDIVLLDNNFASIVNAISEGRIIIDNIRRMLFYLLATSLGGVLTMIAALVFGLPLPVTAIQILWVNLITDTILVIPLGLEPAETNHMKQPPRNPKQPLLNLVLYTRIFAVALAMAAVTIFIVYIFHSNGYPIAYTRSLAFLALIVAQWMNAFNARSENESLLSRLRVPNKKMFAALLAAIALQSLVMFGPLQPILGVVDVELKHLLPTVILMVTTIFAVVEAHKFILQRFSSR